MNSKEIALEMKNNSVITIDLTNYESVIYLLSINTKEGANIIRLIKD